MKKIILLIFIAYLGATPSEAQEAQKQTGDTLFLSVESAIDLAVKNNPDLKRVQLNEKILNEQIKGTKGSVLPQVKGTGGFTDNFSLPQQVLPGEIFGQSGPIAVKFGVRYALNAGVDVNQMLYNKEYLENIKKLDATKVTYRLQTLASKQDLIYNVLQMYIQYQINEKQTEIQQANLDRVAQLERITEVQFNNGIIKKLELDQIRVNRTNLASELFRLEIAGEQTLNVLRFYLALDAEQPIALTEKLDNPTRYPISQELMLSENINYRLLQKQQEITVLDEKVINAGYYPTLSAFARYNYTGQGNQFNLKSDNYSDFGAGSWGLNLSVPIFDGFQRKRKLVENKLKIEQINYDQKTLTASTQMEFRNATTKIIQNEKLIATQLANMELAKEVYDISKLSYQEGITPLTELINAETSLTEAQSQYLTALLNFKLAELDHVKASGQLAKIITQF